MQDVEELRAAAEALGVKVDRRWGVDRLRAEIANAQPVDEPAGDEPAGDQPDESSGDKTLEPVEVEGPGDGPEPVRAGGWVDHGDGRGWVLDEE